MVLTGRLFASGWASNQCVLPSRMSKQAQRAPLRRGPIHADLSSVLASAGRRTNGTERRSSQKKASHSLKPQYSTQTLPLSTSSQHLEFSSPKTIPILSADVRIWLLDDDILPSNTLSQITTGLSTFVPISGVFSSSSAETVSVSVGKAASNDGLETIVTKSTLSVPPSRALSSTPLIDSDSENGNMKSPNKAARELSGSPIAFDADGLPLSPLPYMAPSIAAKPPNKARIRTVTRSDVEEPGWLGEDEPNWLLEESDMELLVPDKPSAHPSDSRSINTHHSPPTKVQVPPSSAKSKIVVPPQRKVTVNEVEDELGSFELEQHTEIIDGLQ